MQSTTDRRAPRGRRTFSSSTSEPRTRRSRRGGQSRRGDRSPSRFEGRAPRHGAPARGGSKRGGRKLPSFDPSQFINKNPIELTPEVYVPKHAFADFAIDRRLVAIIEGMGITTPSPIQDQIIPEILEGRDVIGLAETGTGKTAAFLIPLIEKTRRDAAQMSLILTPTRELALQIEAEFRKLSKNLHLYATTCVGGTNIRPQIKGLKRRNHFIIGTPGRILDLIERGDIVTKKFTNVVLDEADRMLDMGFINDMRRILGGVPKERQTLFFSATMTEEARGLVHDFLRNPIEVSVKKKEVTSSIEQDVVQHNRHNKFDTLCMLLADASFKRVIIFGAMKHSVERLAEELIEHGIKAESIHGNKTHGQRQRSLERFKSGQARVLVATDVAARGIHVDDVSHVINYDLPQTFEDYIHRIGRTGRGTRRGKALTFVPSEAWA